jgi:hypothetical protein
MRTCSLWSSRTPRRVCEHSDGSYHDRRNDAIAVLRGVPASDRPAVLQILSGVSTSMTLIGCESEPPRAAGRLVSL